MSMSSGRFDGKTIVVTGGGSGIGLQTVFLFAAILSPRRLAALRRLASRSGVQLRSLGEFGQYFRHYSSIE